MAVSPSCSSVSSSSVYPSSLSSVSAPPLCKSSPDPPPSGSSDKSPPSIPSFCLIRTSFVTGGRAWSLYAPAPLSARRFTDPNLISSPLFLPAFLLIASATASKPRIFTTATGPPLLGSPSARQRPPGGPDQKARPPDRRLLDLLLAWPHIDVAYGQSSVSHSAALSSCFCR